MSEPKRYQPVVQCVEPSYQAQMIEPKVMEFSEGEYVLHSDYARLKAEVERLTAKQTDIDRVQAQSDFYRSKLINETAYTANVQLLDQVKHLEAQVDRLTKAGDAMEMTLQADFNGCPYEPTIVREAMIYWRNAKNAAKKGGQP